MNMTAQHSSSSLTRRYIRPAHLAYAFLVFAAVASAGLIVLPYPYHWLPFGLMGMAIILLGALKYPFVGLMTYLLIFFLDPNQIFSFLQHTTFPYERIIALLMITSLLIHIAVKEKRFRIFYMDIALGAFLGATFLSILGALDLKSAYDAWEMFLRIVIVYLVIVRICRTTTQLKVVVMLFILSIGFLAISSTIQYYRGEFEIRQGIQRLHSFGGGLIDPNTLATSLILGIPFMYYTAKAHRSLLLKLFMYGLAGSCLWAVILTGSRGGMVGSIVALGLLTWHSRHKVLGMIIALMIVGAVAVSMPEQYQERFMTIFEIGEEDTNGASDSAYGRVEGFILGWKFFLFKNPLTGVGIGNFTTMHHLEENGSWLDAHNLIGKLVGETGLLGIVTFTWFIVRFAKTIRSVRQTYVRENWQKDYLYWLAEAIKIGLILLFVQGMFGHNLYRVNWYFYAALIMASEVILAGRQSMLRTESGRSVPNDRGPLAGTNDASIGNPGLEH